MRGISFMKTHKWYFGILSQILDICVDNDRREINLKTNNASELVSLKHFRYEITSVLILIHKERPRLPLSTEKHFKKHYKSKEKIP